jgi:hypothetical protein
MRAIDFALFDAATSGDLDALRRALHGGARLNVRVSPLGLTPLGAAAAGGHLDVLRELLAAGAKVDATDDLGRTPLLVAAGEGKTDAVRELLRAGADIEAVDDSGETALFEAAQWGHLEVVRALVDMGADAGRVVNGETSYDRAILRKHRQVAELLASHGGTTALTGAKGLATEIARSFGVRARAGGADAAPGWPATQFAMKVIHRGNPIEIGVFDGGCSVIGRGRNDDPVFSLNQPTFGIETRVTEVTGLPIALFRSASTSVDRLRAYFDSAETRQWCSKLRLTGDEFFAHTRERFYLLHRSLDVAVLRERLDLIAELVPPPKPVRLVSETAHRIKLGKTIRAAGGDGARHRYGGELDPPVICRNCKAPAHLLLTIDPTDAALDLKSLGSAPLRIVFCLDCMSFPSLTYVDQSDAHPRIVHQDAGERHDETPPLELRHVQLAPQASAAGAGSKVGGSPRWIQGPEIPDCISCREPMAFLAQIASTRTLSFVDEGTLYTFVCERCRMMASLVQSH